MRQLIGHVSGLPNRPLETNVTVAAHSALINAESCILSAAVSSGHTADGCTRKPCTQHSDACCSIRCAV